MIPGRQDGHVPLLAGVDEARGVDMSAADKR